MIEVSNARRRMRESSFLEFFRLARGKKKAINLAVGQPDLPPPPLDLRELGARAGAFAYTPSEGIPELREAIAGKLLRENRIGCSADDVLVTCGGEEALATVFLTYLNAGDNLIIFSPYFTPYSLLASLAGAEIREVPLPKNKAIDFEDILEAVDERTRMLVVNSPNNPTGTVIKKTDMLRLVHLASKHDLLLLSDEVYEKYIYVGEHFSPGSAGGTVLTINSVSKTFCLPGVRVGYVAGPSELVQPLKLMHMAIAFSAPTPGQLIALACLQDRHSSGYIAQNIRIFKRRRNLLEKLLRERGLEHHPLEGAFYAFVNLPKGMNGAEVSRKLASEGVLVLPGREFGGSEESIRISYAVPEEELLKAFEIIDKHLRPAI